MSKMMPIVSYETLFYLPNKIVRAQQRNTA